jgi:hypothetical protein
MSRAEGNSRTTSVNFPDPYLTCPLFGYFPQAAEKNNGSSGRTRTYSPPVNRETQGVTGYNGNR